MNIAVIFNKGIRDGGSFQYALSISLLLEKHKGDKYNFVYFTTVKENLDILRKYNLRTVYLPWSNLDRLILSLSGSQLVADICSKIKIKLELKLDRIFKKHNIDLIYFLSPTDMALAINCYNYIFTVWDLCFLDSMEFPEVYANREFERRERLYRLAIAKAVAIITDSEFTKKNIINRYGAEERRIVPLHFLPSNAIYISEKTYGEDFIDVNKKYGIKGKYIFYPAQFWPHKNHVYIIEGLRLMKEKYNKIIAAVFSGTDKGNLRFVLKKAEELGVSGQIHYIGFARDKELPYLYKQAMALVMPTYFFPTNIPPLEAFEVGCPVLYSDLPGLREQVKDSAILLDLRNPESLCLGLLKIIENSPGINTMVKNGKERIGFLMKENRWDSLKNIFDDYMLKLKTWK